MNVNSKRWIEEWARDKDRPENLVVLEVVRTRSGPGQLICWVAELVKSFGLGGVAESLDDLSIS